MKTNETSHLWRQTPWVISSSSVLGVKDSGSCLYFKDHHSASHLQACHQFPQGYGRSVLGFPIHVEDLSLQGLTWPVDLVDDVYTCRAVMLLNINSRAPILTKHSDKTMLCSGDSVI